MVTKAALYRSSSIHDNVVGHLGHDDDAMARASTKADSSSFSPSLFFAPLWSALYSCADLLCMSGEDDTTNNNATTHHRVQNASLMEFMGNGMGGILHKDSMSTVGEDTDLSPDTIYGNKFNLDQAMQDFGSEEPAQQHRQDQQQTQEHRTPSMQSLSDASSSSSLSHEAEVVVPKDEAVRRQTSLEDQEVEEGAKDHIIAGVPTAPPLPLEMTIPVPTMPRPMTPVL